MSFGSTFEFSCFPDLDLVSLRAPTRDFRQNYQNRIVLGAPEELVGSPQLVGDWVMTLDKVYDD